MELINHSITCKRLPILVETQVTIKVLMTWYLISSLILFLLYGLDKNQAIAGGRRIPEKVFHILALLGGFTGGFFGRAFFHHKTRKPLFLWILFASMLLHGLMWWIWLK
jgi:uncharacterized membrane protein YsdA (DUF1294 family)